MAQHGQKRVSLFEKFVCHGNDDATASIGQERTPIKLRLNSEYANLFYLPHTHTHKMPHVLTSFGRLQTKEKLFSIHFVVVRNKKHFFTAISLSWVLFN